MRMNYEISCPSIDTVLLGRFLGFSLEVKDMDNFYQKSIELGIIFTGPPEEQVWGGIMTHVIDCSGNTFSVVQVENKA